MPLKQGMYKPKNPEKYVGKVDAIVYRSGWELAFMKRLDTSANVKRWNSEDIHIEYYSTVDRKHRRYMVDFFVEFTTGKRVLVEIKPLAQTRKPKPPKLLTEKTKRKYAKDYKTWLLNRDKWKAAALFAKRRGLEFQVITEKSLGSSGILNNY